MAYGTVFTSAQHVLSLYDISDPKFQNTDLFFFMVSQLSPSFEDSAGYCGAIYYAETPLFLYKY